MNNWLIVPCQGERQRMLQRLLVGAEHPAELTVVVTTTLDPVEPCSLFDTLLVLPWTGHHISRWWNEGLDAVDEMESTDDHVVVCASSDTIGPPGAVGALASVLRERGWAMAGPNWHGDDTHELPPVRTVVERVPGACWAMPAHLGARADESFRWWYSDDDLETHLRQLGPVGLVGGTGLVQGEPDSYMTEDQAQHALEDRARYVEKWGKEPW